MHIVYGSIVVLHLLGMASVVGSYLVVLRSPRILPGFLHGALTQLVTGIALVGLRESGAVSGEDKLNQGAIGVKLLIALVVAGLVIVNRKKTDKAPAGVVHAIGGLAIVNVIIGAFL